MHKNTMASLRRKSSLDSIVTLSAKSSFDSTAIRKRKNISETTASFSRKSSPYTSSSHSKKNTPDSTKISLSGKSTPSSIIGDSTRNTPDFARAILGKDDSDFARAVLGKEKRLDIEELSDIRKLCDVALERDRSKDKQKSSDHSRQSRGYKGRKPSPVHRDMSQLSRSTDSRKMSTQTIPSSDLPLDDSWDMHGRRKFVPTYENTYRLVPEPHKRFKSYIAHSIIADVLESCLQGEHYDKKLSVGWSKTMADIIKERVKKQGFSHRYKYVCLVTIGQKKYKHAVTVSSRCVWDADVDSYASASYTGGDLYAVAILFACYYE